MLLFSLLFLVFVFVCVRLQFKWTRVETTRRRQNCQTIGAINRSSMAAQNYLRVKYLFSDGKMNFIVDKIEQFKFDKKKKRCEQKKQQRRYNEKLSTDMILLCSSYRPKCILYLTFYFNVLPLAHFTTFWSYRKQFYSFSRPICDWIYKSFLFMWSRLKTHKQTHAHNSTREMTIN